MKSPLDLVLGNKAIKSIINVLFSERSAGKPGVSLSKLSEKTGIERHKLSGMIEVLALMGVIAIFQIGMVKMVAVDPKMLDIMSKAL